MSADSRLHNLNDGDGCSVSRSSRFVSELASIDLGKSISPGNHRSGTLAPGKTVVSLYRSRSFIENASVL
jgi:hypothetical protein